MVKSLKFACSFSSKFGSPIFTIPKKERPIIANMKNKMIRSSPSEPKDPDDSNSVWKMIYNCTACLISLRIRPIRKALSIVAPLPNCTGMLNTLRSRMRSVNITIVKSKIFHESLKYIFFCAISLMIASSVKIPAKT